MSWCYCYRCQRQINSMGIARHRAMHRDKKEDAEIMYKDGSRILHLFSDTKELKE